MSCSSGARKKASPKGEAIGKTRGEAKGEAKILSKFLEKRFGPLPESIRTRIASADTTALDRWVDRFADAESLDAVLAESLTPPPIVPNQ
jgi:hypothetical protein